MDTCHHNSVAVAEDAVSDSNGTPENQNKTKSSFLNCWSIDRENEKVLVVIWLFILFSKPVMSDDKHWQVTSMACACILCLGASPVVTGQYA